MLSSDWLKNYVTSLAQWSEKFVLFRQPIRGIYLVSIVFPRFTLALRVFVELNSDWFFLIVCLFVIGQSSQKAPAASIFFCDMVALIG